MKNITKLAVVALFGFAMFTTIVNAGSIEKGQKIYAKNIKAQCAGKNGGQFAATLTQKEWEDVFKTGIFKAKVKEICPTMETYKDEWTPFLFEFAYEYAKDTGNEPAC
ncbi:MAG: cytochrome C [Sulfurovum sp.]|nr:cytochrome C [Sulfurovum sp.]